MIRKPVLNMLLDSKNNFSEHSVTATYPASNKQLLNCTTIDLEAMKERVVAD